MKYTFLLLLFLFSWVLKPFCFAQNLSSATNSLQTQLNLVTDTAKVNLLIKISLQYGYNDPVKAVSYAQQALQLAEKLNFTQGIASAYNELGGGYYYQNQYAKAIESHQKALEINRSLGNLKGQRLSLNNLGLVYHKQFNYPKALEYYLQSLKISEQEGDKKLIASAYNNIGNIYSEQHTYDKALAYYNKALALRKEIFTSGRKVSQILNNIGDTYLNQKHYEKAIPYFNAALKDLTEQDKDVQAVFLTNLGFVHGGMKGGGLKKYHQALQYLNEALQIQEAIEDNYMMAHTLLGIAYVYQFTSEPAISEKYAQRSLALAQPLEIKGLVADVYLILSQLAETQRNYRQAYQYHLSYVQTQESISNEQTTQQIAQLQANYEIDKKQAEIELLKKDSEKDALLRNGIAVGLLATLIIGALIVSRQRLKIRKNRLLLEKSAEVAQKNRQLEAQASVLEQQAAALSS